MIADDRRRSQIADRRSQTIADDRKKDCFHIIATIAETTVAVRFGQRKCQIYTRVQVEEQTTSRTWKSANSAASNLLLLFVMKRRRRQLQNRRKHRFWIRLRPYAVLMLQNLASASPADKLNFCPILSQQLAFLFLSLKSLLLRW